MTASPDTYPFPLGPVGEPPEAYARLRGHRPVSQVRMPSGDTAWYVTGYAEVEQALGDPRLSRAALREPGAPRVIPGPDFGDNPYNLLSQEGPDHQRLRRLISPAFTPRKAEALRARVAQIANELIDELTADRERADLHRDYAVELPVRVIAEMLGARAAELGKLQEWTDRLVSITAHTDAERLQAREESAAYIAALVAERRARPGEDLLSALITARDDQDRLDERELVWLGINILVAGHDTTVSAISRGLFMLLGHPEQWRQLVDRPELLAHATEELLRYAPPSEIGFLRIATEDTEIGGCPVAKGEGVIPVMHAAGRDHRELGDPDVLDLTRPREEAGRHLAFGHGPHYCPGAGVARMELQVAFGQLARRLPKLTLAVPPEQVEWIGGLLTLRPRELPVVW
ncbi:cytochrome P450 [Actinospica robiniae]|uniref:cytochrome P450 n=1 Tax=Actinospica robiniae TaxID=304901 RepID=UPI0003FE8212|nr:cytochrome P450 [Actinospica robiniae]